MYVWNVHLRLHSGDPREVRSAAGVSNEWGFPMHTVTQGEARATHLAWPSMASPARAALRPAYTYNGQIHALAVVGPYTSKHKSTLRAQGKGPTGAAVLLH